uniref:Uncharacterized protein n=1 Tax=Nelumbo nucifera TaxID=4432 RepID=A0A822ZS35_NELNU|nr:TPA_asm: hypothetical protein HUJ06_002888 [Nelumbo nucifera]
MTSGSCLETERSTTWVEEQTQATNHYYERQRLRHVWRDFCRRSSFHLPLRSRLGLLSLLQEVTDEESEDIKAGNMVGGSDSCTSSMSILDLPPEKTKKNNGVKEEGKKDMSPPPELCRRRFAAGTLSPPMDKSYSVV